MSKVLSFSGIGSRRYNNPNKIELLSCRSGGKNCQNHLSLINQKYSKAYNFQLEKDYINSIKALKDAFYITSEIHESSCTKCAALFRLTLTESLENINNELHKLTSGIFGKKKYEFSYIESCNVLREFQKNVQHASVK